MLFGDDISLKENLRCEANAEDTASLGYRVFVCGRRIPGVTGTKLCCSGDDISLKGKVKEYYQRPAAKQPRSRFTHMEKIEASLGLGSVPKPSLHLLDQMSGVV